MWRRQSATYPLHGGGWSEGSLSALVYSGPLLARMPMLGSGGGGREAGDSLGTRPPEMAFPLCRSRRVFIQLHKERRVSLPSPQQVHADLHTVMCVQDLHTDHCQASHIRMPQSDACLWLLTYLTPPGPSYCFHQIEDINASECHMRPST